MCAIVMILQNLLRLPCGVLPPSALVEVTGLPVVPVRINPWLAGDPAPAAVRLRAACLLTPQPSALGAAELGGNKTHSLLRT